MAKNPYQKITQKATKTTSYTKTIKKTQTNNPYLKFIQATQSATPFQDIIKKAQKNNTYTERVKKYNGGMKGRNERLGGKLGKQRQNNQLQKTKIQRWRVKM